MRRLGIAVALVAVVVVALATVSIDGHPVRANDIAEFETVFATDVASAGFGGMRGIGDGEITLSGVSGTVTEALLYWHGPTNSDDATANADVTFAGTDITGTNIGFSDNNCWGFQNSQAYRADVTSLVTGDAVYSLSNFLGTSADINGASLIAFFDDGDDTNNRDVVLFHGNDSNIPNPFDADGWNVTLPGINYDTGSANMELHVSDGQTFSDDALTLNGAITLVSSGPVFDGDSVPNGPSAAGTGGGLWDIKSFDVTSALTPGDNTLTLTTGLSSDCLSLIVAAVDLPGGAAPNQPPTIALDPATDTNTVGEDHTVTATVLQEGDPLDADVEFEVTDGPNAGDTGSDTTDVNGESTFTYTGDGGAGTDTIQACVVDFPELCATATKTWVEPTATPTPTPTPTVLAATATPTPAPTPVALPASGGTPSDGGSGALPWLAAIAGAIALIGSGSAWFAHQSRRVR